MRWSLSAEAQTDLADAAMFYREQASILVAEAFLSEFARAATVVGLNPGLGTPTLKGRRIFPMRRFPYSLIYRVESDEVLISVVAHQTRKPRYWNKRS